MVVFNIVGKGEGMMFRRGVATVPNETVQIIRASKDLIPPCHRHSAAIS